MLHFKKFLRSILLFCILISLFAPYEIISAKPSNDFIFIVLSEYNAVVDIDQTFYIAAVTSNGKPVTWKSSNSKIVSVNSDGKVTAKKSGTATITAKLSNARAYCKITVNQTKIVIDTTSVAIEHGELLKLSASSSNHSKITWKSSKRSIATVDRYGTVTSLKPGQTIITASANGSSVACILTVKSPTILLDKTSLLLYRGQTSKLTATVSSNISPMWKSSRKKVAVVDQTGTVTALKNGTVTITATVDGISKTCQVIVLKPDITLSQNELYLKKGTQATITATVSSNNSPKWSSSNSDIATVNSNGEIKALKKGTAYIYASEDGARARCTIRVTE